MIKTIAMALAALLISGTAFAQFQTTTPNGSGGWTTYNYGTGTFKSTTPNGSGGYTTYDYGRGQFSTATPNGSGGYTTYTYPKTR